MSKELRDLLDELKSKSAEAQALQSKAGVTVEELNAKLNEIKTIKAKIETQKALDSGKNFDANGNVITDPIKPPASKEEEDKFSSLEYRKAFMDFCTQGIKSSVLVAGPSLGNINSADANGGTSDVSAIVPTTILNEIIKKLQSYGQVYNEVRKLSVQGGLQIPILSLKPTASWIGDPGTSDRQKVSLNTNISFSYFGLECRISTSIISNAVSLPMFENTIVSLITEAIVHALDLAIIKGTGVGQPLGITVDTRVPKGNVVTLAPTDFTNWSAWKKKVFAKMPIAYKGGAKFYVAGGTFEGYIDGMTDANGQPIGRVNYGIQNGPQEQFGGKPVVQVEDDIVSNYDDAATGDVVAIYGNLTNYVINSNMQLQMYRYLDQNTNQYVDKAILVCDGKLADPNGIIIVKKGAAA